MDRHIMLLFLSVFNLENNKLRESEYFDLRGVRTTGYHTNENALSYVCRENGVDKVFILTTKAVKEKLVYTNDEGDTIETTAFDLFLNLMEQVDSGTRGKVIPIDFDETAASDKYYLPVEKVASLIEEDVENNLHKGAKTYLHVDITGGKRDTSMLMSLVMQLLQYNGITLAEVLYNNYDFAHKRGLLEDNTPIFDMTKLLAGAEAFVQYGNVGVLNTYFKKTDRSIALTELISAMGRFADALNLCRTNLLVNSIDELKNAIQNFKNQPHVGMQESMFVKLLSRIEQEYAPIFRDDATSFDIIRWCINKNYLQQAMTFYTEWAPTEIVRNGILYPSAKKIQVECEKSKNLSEKYVTWQKHFITTFKLSEALTKLLVGKDESELGDITGKLKTLRNYADTKAKNNANAFLMTLVKQNKDNVYDDCFVIESAVKDVATIKDKLQKKAFNLETLKEQDDVCYRVVKRMMEEQKYRRGIGTYWSTVINDSLVYKFFANISERNYLYVFQNIRVKKSPPKTQKETLIEKSIEEEKSEKVSARVGALAKMMEEGLIATDIEVERGIDIAKKYLEIKSLRNSINHASAEANDIPTWQLMLKLKQSMKCIEKYYAENVASKKESTEC